MLVRVRWPDQWALGLVPPPTPRRRRLYTNSILVTVKLRRCQGSHDRMGNNSSSSRAKSLLTQTQECQLTTQIKSTRIRVCPWRLR